MNDGAEPPAVRTWPPGRALDDAEAHSVQCAACGAPWRVHKSLAGFRLRCDCGAWIEMPAPPQSAPMLAPPANEQLPARVDPRQRDAAGLITLPNDPGEMVFTPIRTDLPMAPGTLVDASPSNRARWTNRTLFEFAAVFVALVGPQLAALLLARGREFELLLPFASLASGALVALVVALGGPYGRLGFTRTASRYFAEAIAAAAIALLFALGWLMVLRAAMPDLDDPLRGLTERLGLPATLLVVAVAPAVLEEIMFRGMLQGRLLALLGTRAGLVTTAAAFALCHGMPAVLPIHLALGLYLGWLRQRAGSLLPGMLMHFTYNGAIVVLGVG